MKSAVLVKRNDIRREKGEKLSTRVGNSDKKEGEGGRCETQQIGKKCCNEQKIPDKERESKARGRKSRRDV